MDDIPYVTEQVRKQLGFRHPENAGELTYEVTELVLKYINRNGESFARYAEVLAALEATKLELYRRNISKYEDGKIVANGDLEGFTK